MATQAIRVKYSDWEQQQLKKILASHAQRDAEGGPEVADWAKVMFPEAGPSQFGGEGEPTSWNLNRFGEQIPGPAFYDLPDLQSRLARVGGYSGIGFDPQAELSGLRSSMGGGYYTPDAEGYMYVPQFNQSQFGDFVEWASPLATMAGMAYGGNALFGPGGAFAGAGVAPEVGAQYSGLDAATLAGADLVGAGAAGAAGYTGAGMANVPFGGYDPTATFGPSTYTPSVDPLNVVTAPPTGVPGIDTPGLVKNLAGGGMVPAVPYAPSYGNLPTPTSTPTPPPAPVEKSIFDKALGNPQLLGMAGGALLGGMSSRSGDPAGTIKTEEGLPDWLKAYAKPALDQYGTQLQNYQIDPYGIMAGAGQQYRDTVNGMYLDPSTNKYLTDYFNAGAERIKSTLSPSFGHMQAFGSHSGYNEALSRGLGDFATGLYGNNYAQERDRQTQLTAAAPNFLQSQSQAAFAPYQGYLSTISGLGKQKEQPYFKANPFQNILGGAMMGYGLGNIFK